MPVMNKELKEKLEKCIIHYVRNGHVHSYYNIDGILFPLSNEIKTLDEAKPDAVFSDIREARYHMLVNKLQEGKSLSDYRASPYYSFYVDRLEIDYPEYVI